MKILTVYSSQTGNTKKLAETANAILPEPKEIFKIEQAPSPDTYDIIILGFWFKAGQPDPASAEYLKKIVNKKVFLFATHGAAPDSEHAQHGMEIAKAMVKKCELLGTFNCPGEVNPKVLEKAGTKPNPPIWLKDAPQAKGHPTTEDLNTFIQTLNRAISRLNM